VTTAATGKRAAAAIAAVKARQSRHCCSGLSSLCRTHDPRRPNGIIANPNTTSPAIAGHRLATGKKDEKMTK
jgi:hypothetical protein